MPQIFLKLLTTEVFQLYMAAGCSFATIGPTPQVMSAVTSGLFYSSFPSAGMMQNGWLWEVDTVPLPSLESEYCWLPSPGALSFAGKGRPPGQTKQEAWLKKQGLLQKGEVLNPAILCEWYAIPPNWLDPSECRAATELLEECAKQQEIFSVLSRDTCNFRQDGLETVAVSKFQRL